MAASSENMITYDDDKALGAVAPSIELLDFLKGNKFDLTPGKVVVLYFWSKFYKGGYGCGDQMSDLAAKYPEAIWVGVGTDPERGIVDGFIKSPAVNVLTSKPHRMDLPFICWDEGRRTSKMYGIASGLATLGVPHAFIIDRNGKIAWRQALSQSYVVSQSNFEEQLQHVLKGEPLAKAGAAPKIVDEGVPADVPDDMSLF
jgi:peroxiredoxin